MRTGRRVSGGGWSGRGGMREPLMGDDGCDRFAKSLRELRELRSQLHHAADHCESAFRQASRKKLMVDHTKEYVRKAAVTVVDHLGNVAANLEGSLDETSVVEVSQAERRIDYLSQRLLTSLQYSVAVDLSALRSSVRFPRHLTRYVAPYRDVDGVSNGTTGGKDGATESTASEACGRDEDLVIRKLVADYVETKLSRGHLKLGTELSKVLPVLESHLTPSRPSTRYVDSPAERGRMLGKVNQKKKSVLSAYFTSSLWRGKRGP